MGRSIKLVLPGIPPSMNAYAGRENCQEYRSEKSNWTNMVLILSKRFHLPEPFKKADVTIEYFFADNRRHDPDKFLLDGLTKGGIIADDSFDHIDLHLAKGGVDPKRPHVLISVVEV